MIFTMKGGISKMNCRRCKQFKLHDGIFGYCRRYHEQALLTENCEEIKEKTRK